MNIMFLMGARRNEADKGYYPLYLNEFGDKTILEKQIEYARIIAPRRFLFALQESDMKMFRSDAVIKQIVPEAEIAPIKAQTKGALCTAMLGAQYIDNSEELLLMSIDDFIEDNGADIIAEFRVKNADAGVVSFYSVHPRYSFVKVDAKDGPIEFAEKNPISKNALVSFYYFRRGADFMECAKEVIRKDNSVNGNFYISQVMNEMILKQKKIALRRISNDRFHPLKTEQQTAEYLAELRDKRNSK